MTKHRQHQNSRPSPDSGYTILEAIMAIVVVSVLMISIAPMVVFSTATRVQAKRVELATQAARAYIDAVRSRAADAPTQTVNVTAGNLDVNLIAAADAPVQGNLSCTASTYCAVGASQLYCVDLDGDGQCTSTSLRDMMVQGFRSETTGGKADDGYLLGVRVYRADAFQASVGALTNTGKATTVTSGLGNRNSPLVAMTTEISAKSETITTPFQGLCKRLNTNGQCQ